MTSTKVFSALTDMRANREISTEGLDAASQVNKNHGGTGGDIVTLAQIAAEYKRRYPLRQAWNPEWTSSETGLALLASSWSILVKSGYPENQDDLLCQAGNAMEGCKLFKYHAHVIWYLMVQHQKACVDFCRASPCGAMVLNPTKYRDETAGIHNSLCRGAVSVALMLKDHQWDYINMPEGAVTRLDLVRQAVKDGGYSVQLRTEKLLEKPEHGAYKAAIANFKAALELAASEDFPPEERDQYRAAFAAAEQEFAETKVAEHLNVVGMIRDNTVSEPTGKCCVCLTKTATFCGSCMHATLCLECMEAMKRMSKSDRFPCVICRQNVVHKEIKFQ